MSANVSLRKRIVLGVVCFTILITLATSLLGSWFDEQAEQRVWETMFRSELARRILNPPGHDVSRPPEQPFLAFGAKFGMPVPPEFSGLGSGIHDDVQLGDRLYVIDVEGTAKEPVALALDITDMEHRESNLDLDMLIAGIFAVVLLVVFTYLVARWLVRPLTQLSEVIGRLRPGVKGQQLDVRSSDPEEVAVISRAFNAYLRAIDGHAEREHRFLTMASHELRTPLAVISGAAEVAIEQPTVEQARVHISRIAEASLGMQELVVLLLALARDPPRLWADVISVDLATLVPRVVADHGHLLNGKELAIVYGEMPPTPVSLPGSIAAAVIGNLVRNAIENSSRGTIAISLDASGILVIKDPGSSMSPAERSGLQARLARAGQGRGDGIGLDLVRRLCEHVGWTLDLEVGTSGGTTARLGFRSKE